jgi:VWFA-related protein
LKEALTRIPAESGTNFYDALHLSAHELLQQATGERKAIIVLSDGVDTSSYYDFEQISQLLERSGITAYFIEVDTQDDMIQGLKGERRGKPRLTLSPAQLEKYRRAFRPDEPPAFYRQARLFSVDERVEMARGLYKLAHEELRRLAERTGGRVFPLKDFSQLNAIYAQISAELSTLYSIGYYPINAKRDGTWRSLRVDVAVPNAKAHARSGYWAPSK